MAQVYRAEQDLTGGISRPVALKVIRPEYSESEDFRGMFLDEARTACTLSHPNIVHIYEVGETDDGLLYMAMELVSGETLATLNRTLREYGERLGDEALFAVGIATCSALEAVHALKVEGGHANLVHRDVSPHNLLLSTAGALKLIDFGIAKAATNRNLTMPGVTKGKAGYFSPEQAMGKKLDGRSDLFSLGVTLYKLASGGTPFDDYKNHAERHAALVRGQWQHLDDVFPGLPRGFYEVLRRALALKPEDRYPTAREMREAFEKAAFDARVRVTQGSLEGYLDGDGEVTASGGPRASSQPDEAPPVQEPLHLRETLAPVAGTAPVAQPSEQSLLGVALKPPRAVTSRRRLLVGVFAAAVLVGVGGTFAAVSMLGADTPAPTPPATPRPVVVAEVRPSPTPPVPEQVPEPPTTPVIDAGEVLVVVDDAPVKAKPKVVRATKDRPKERPAPVEKAAAPAREEVIPEGTGKLAIDVSTGVGQVSVDGAPWGAPPVMNKLASGHHRVVVKLPSGQQFTRKATVFPDQTVRMKLDAATGEWK